MDEECLLKDNMRGRKNRRKMKCQKNNDEDGGK